MSTGDRSTFESMDQCEGTPKIASGTRMPIKGRGIVRIDLPRGQARLGGVIFFFSFGSLLILFRLQVKIYFYMSGLLKQNRERDVFKVVRILSTHPS